MLMDLVALKNKYKCNFKGVYHIGGHIGQEGKIYKTLDINPILFFEPLLTNVSRLIDNCERDHVDALVVPMAVSPVDGYIEMYTETANDGQSSSCLKPDLHLLQYPNIEFKDKVKVKTCKLDDYANYKCNFINIDVQGYELEALKTGTEVLKSVDYVIAEVNRYSVYRNCALVEEMDEFLLKFGLVRVETTWDGITWGDAFYVKNSL